MWYKSITARAFGPLRDRELEFEPGLNVIHGPNEAGKSTWHAAITAALCGLRRRRGRDTAREEFTARHRPWGAADGDPWRVETEVVLEDGRRLAIDRDFENGRCKARRADLGGRVFDDLAIYDGSPDGSMLLGLDRETFPMTASVRQASIVTDLAEPDALQAHLARAAAGGTGGTAAGALEKLAQYKKDHVGLDRKNSTKPLRAARNAASEAEANLRAVERARQDYLRQVSDRQERLQQVERLTSDRVRAKAQLDFCAAKREVDRLDAAVREIGDWEKRFSAGDPSQREIAVPVELSDALARVESFPGPAVTKLDAALDLERRLEELDGPDDPPCPELLEVQRCVEPLRHLISQESDEVRNTAPLARPVLLALVVAVVSAVAVGVLFGVGAGLMAAVVGSAVVALATRGGRRTRDGGTRQAPPRPPGASESAVRGEAERRLSEWRLPSDPDAAVREASSRLQARTERSARRRRLVDDLGRRRTYDQEEADRRKQHEEAWTRLRKLARPHGVEGSDDEVRRRVKKLLDAHKEALERRDGEVREWGRYQGALAGRGPLDWQDDADVARRTANACLDQLRELGVEPIDPPRGTSDLEAEVDGLDREIQQASDKEKLVEGKLSQVDQESVDVAAAEARLSEAQAELDRVERLVDTLDTTRDFLERAAEKAHMLVAPRLSGQMSRWIPKVTNGRYARVEVDPGDLSITLVTAAGERSDARLVSQGTMEQVYLVLRLVLAQVLSADHETCPVLLDDPTVHADANRKQQILDYLLAASKEHQVILFSQEQEVLDWAKNQLDGEVHLIELADP